MVAAANWTSRPLVGCDQVLAARERMAALIAPRAGGELKSEPMTEKRKRAHESPGDPGDVWVITLPHKVV
jgi:hypothetical protein